MEKKSCVIFDLDGTLCELKRYPDENRHTGNEKVIIGMREELMKEWYPLDIDIIILTGRKRKYGKITQQWLQDNEIYHDDLIMQEGRTAEKNEIFKEKMLVELMKDYQIAMVYDDNPKVWEVCQRLGIPFYPCYS